MGGSVLAQTLAGEQAQFGGDVPDLDAPQMLVNLVNAVNALRAQGRVCSGLPRPQRRRPSAAAAKRPLPVTWAGAARTSTCW